MRPLDLCVHEAGHAIVGVRLRGPCVKRIDFFKDGSAETVFTAAVNAGNPIENAAVDFAGHLAEKMFGLEGGMSDSDRDSANKWFEKWIAPYQNGPAIEQRAYRSKLARVFLKRSTGLANAILREQWDDLISLTETLQAIRPIPAKYLASGSLETKQHPQQSDARRLLAEVKSVLHLLSESDRETYRRLHINEYGYSPSEVPERKTIREINADRHAARLEASAFHANDLSSDSLPRSGWGV